jgi:hypothetical protein
MHARQRRFNDAQRLIRATSDAHEDGQTAFTFIG